MKTNTLTPEAIKILSDLRQNNNRQWYQDNKERVQAQLIEPAKELVVEVGNLLKKHIDGLVADPRVDRSIYRIHRDTRFSSDKTPYKDHLGLIWWQDYPEGKMESPCFYFHLMEQSWLWSVGCYRFSASMLKSYRQNLLDKKRGEDFLKIVQKLTTQGLIFNPPELKRPPAGLTADENIAPWLCHKGLYTWSSQLPINKDLFTSKAASFLVEQFLVALPLYRWLVGIHDHVGEAPSTPKKTPIKRYYAEDF
jgi:uncharacterized protein (TIGR02453 family)